MKYYRFPQWKWGGALIGLVLLGLLLISRESYYCTMVIPFVTCQAVTYGILAALGLAFLGVNRKNLGAVFTDTRMVAAAVFAVALLAPMAL